MSPSSVVTPLMFEYGILERARQNLKHIVLPEGNDDRILRAASTLLQRKVVKLTILGVEATVRARATELGLDSDRGRHDRSVHVGPPPAVRRGVRAHPFAARGCTVVQAATP